MFPFRVCAVASGTLDVQLPKEAGGRGEQRGDVPFLEPPRVPRCWAGAPSGAAGSGAGEQPRGNGAALSARTARGRRSAFLGAAVSAAEWRPAGKELLGGRNGAARGPGRRGRPGLRLTGARRLGEAGTLKRSGCPPLGLRGAAPFPARRCPRAAAVAAPGGGASALNRAEGLSL